MRRRLPCACRQPHLVVLRCPDPAAPPGVNDGAPTDPADPLPRPVLVPVRPRHPLLPPLQVALDFSDKASSEKLAAPQVELNCSCLRSLLPLLVTGQDGARPSFCTRSTRPPVGDSLRQRHAHPCPPCMPSSSPSVAASVICLRSCHVGAYKLQPVVKILGAPCVSLQSRLGYRHRPSNISVQGPQHHQIPGCPCRPAP
ncbi:uncharacterized protein [Triticum aestivum]|uniref:uncharacterized protein n=1 Tax=Triticum aestivum TaxID=4565 RepID=UPI001D005AAA|nr:uncharacterized protein LOC123097299 [Triticum aestivum]